MPRTRISIAIYLVLVFGSGIMVGLVSYRLYAANTASANYTAPPQSMSEYRKRYLDGMRTKVGASEAQIAAITRELDETKRKYDALAAEEQPLHDKIQQDHINEIKAMLNDKQKIAYDNWRAERERAKRQSRQTK